MTEDDWKPLRALGFDDKACLEVAHIVGIFNHLTRLADGFGLQLNAHSVKEIAGEAFQAVLNGIPSVLIWELSKE